jgi:phospholipase C
MKSSFDLSRRWRATTALCIVSTLAIATASYGAEWGRSSWDKRSHSHSGNHDRDGGQDRNDHDGDDKGEASKTASQSSMSSS